jgi:hypothetical protein
MLPVQIHSAALVFPGEVQAYSLPVVVADEQNPEVLVICKRKGSTPDSDYTLENLPRILLDWEKNYSSAINS